MAVWRTWTGEGLSNQRKYHQDMSCCWWAPPLPSPHMAPPLDKVLENQGVNFLLARPADGLGRIMGLGGQSWGPAAKMRWGPGGGGPHWGRLGSPPCMDSLPSLHQARVVLGGLMAVNGMASSP